MEAACLRHVLGARLSSLALGPPPISDMLTPGWHRWGGDMLTPGWLRWGGRDGADPWLAQVGGEEGGNC